VYGEPFRLRLAVLDLVIDDRRSAEARLTAASESLPPDGPAWALAQWLRAYLDGGPRPALPGDLDGIFVQRLLG